ncbi:hypothetical protein SEA_BIG4_344 [Microbacterium phage Big4]|nr:hypothetical protein SEA_BIG4_18 [Microbacterium phage Big4]URP22377.1 hypothetical protein SEA_BIG4_344 [Microbacterium phage Big4]
MALHTRNITAVFRSADAALIEEGIAWYSDAKLIAEAFAAKHDVSLVVSAGVLAALSPLNSWGNNVNLAARMLASKGTLDSGYLKANLAKARRIMAEGTTEALGGLKVNNFYASIVSGGAEGVTIDRHAWCIAHNDRSKSNNIPSLSPKRYAEIAECYTRAARILSREYGMPLSPAVVQAVTWVVWRRRYWGAGAFDNYNMAELGA